jgi:GT2 family glycosyltransferase
VWIVLDKKVQNIQVSIIIVNYKTPQLLHNCIASIYAHTSDVIFEIIVVDNQSEDESETLIRQDFKDVIWINAGSNLGFGKANNLGIKKAKGEFILLLNSDTDLYENAIYKTLHFFTKNENLRIGLVGCKIQNRDFSLQPSANYYFPGLRDLAEENAIVLLFWCRLLGKKILKNIDKYDKLNTTHALPWVGVPFAMIKKSTFEETGGFDEDFFMYSEDKELNYRLQKLGYQNYFFHETGIFHVNGGSSGFAAKRSRQILVSKWLFILKAHNKSYYFTYILLQYLNYIVDDIFFLLAKIKGKATSIDIEIAESRKFYYKCLRKYAFKIPFKYQSFIHSSPTFLNTYNDSI